MREIKYSQTPARISLQTSLAPVPVTSLTCDGNTYKCTGKLVRESQLTCIYIRDWNWNWKISEVWWQQMGSPVGSVDFPPSSVRRPRIRCEFSAAIKINGNTLTKKTPLERDGPRRPWVGSCQKLTYDFNTYKFAANLVSSLLVLDGWFLRYYWHCSVVQEYGDGRWVAQWNVDLERRLSPAWEEISQERERSTHSLLMLVTRM